MGSELDLLNKHNQLVPGTNSHMEPIISPNKFARFLRGYRDQYENKVSITHYHVSEVNQLTQDIIDFLQGITTANDSTKKALRLCIDRLQQVIINSNEFNKGIKLTSGRFTGKPDEYTYANESFWYEEVIGYAEGAINALLDYLGEER